LLANFDKMKN